MSLAADNVRITRPLEIVMAKSNAPGLTELLASSWSLGSHNSSPSE